MLRLVISARERADPRAVSFARVRGDPDRRSRRFHIKNTVVCPRSMEPRLTTARDEGASPERVGDTPRADRPPRLHDSDRADGTGDAHPVIAADFGAHDAEVNRQISWFRSLEPGKQEDSTCEKERRQPAPVQTTRRQCLEICLYFARGAAEKDAKTDARRT